MNFLFLFRSVTSRFAALAIALAGVVCAQVTRWSNVPMEGGGFVSAVIPSPLVPGLVYARTDVGGAYRWDPARQIWIPLTDWISEQDVGLMGVEALALDPSDADRVYLLTGTSYFSGGRTMIFRSRNRGATWDTIDVSAQWRAHGNGMGRQTGEKLAVDPRRGSILLCGTRTRGLFRSVDTGRTWTQVSTEGSGGTDLVQQNGVAFVLFDPASPPTAEGGTSVVWMGLSRTTSNLWRSTDGGRTWQEVPGGPAGLMTARAVLIGGGLAIVYNGSPGPHSVTRGAVWRVIPGSGSPTWMDITPADGNTPFGTGHGFGGISVHPSDTSRLLLTTINHYGGQWRTASGKEGWGDRVFRSGNGGRSWTNLVTFAANDGSRPNLDTAGSPWIGGHSIHWAGSIAHDPFDPSAAWVTSGNGVFHSADITVQAPVFAFRSQGIEETVPLDVVSVPGGPLVTAIGDYDGSVYHDISRPAPLHEPRIGTTHSLGHAPLVHHFLRAGQVTDYSTGSGITSAVMFLSTDTARTWTRLPTPRGPHGRLAMSADGRVLFHRPDNGSAWFRSVDRGLQWTSVVGLDGQAGGSARMVPDPVRPERLYLLDGQGVLMRSVDTGRTFSRGGTVVDNSRSLWSNSSGLIRTVPGRSGHLWVPLDVQQSWTPGGYSRNGLAVSTDGGTTFERISAVNLSTAVGIGMAAPGSSYETLYIWGQAHGGPMGIWRSTDRGLNWTRINDDAHQFGGPGNGELVVGDMNRFGRVFMSTVGRGLVVGTLDEGGPAMRPETPRPVGPRITLRGGLPVVEGLTPNQNARLELRDLSGRILSVGPQNARLQGAWAGRGVKIALLWIDGALVDRLRIVQP